MHVHYLQTWGMCYGNHSAGPNYMVMSGILDINVPLPDAANVPPPFVNLHYYKNRKRESQQRYKCDKIDWFDTQDLLHEWNLHGCHINKKRQDGTDQRYDDSGDDGTFHHQSVEDTLLRWSRRTPQDSGIAWRSAGAILRPRGGKAARMSERYKSSWVTEITVSHTTT